MSARGGLSRRLPAQIWANPEGFIALLLGPFDGVDRDADGTYVVLVDGRRIRTNEFAYLPHLRRALNALGRWEGRALPLQTGSWLTAAVRRAYWQQQQKASHH